MTKKFAVMMVVLLLVAAPFGQAELEKVCRAQYQF